MLCGVYHYYEMKGTMEENFSIIYRLCTIAKIRNPQHAHTFYTFL